MGKVIDYRVIYDRLKDVVADRWSPDLDRFGKLYEWKLNDTRKDEES